MTIRRSIAVLTIVTAVFGVACETEEDPGGDGGVGYMGDTNVEHTQEGPADSGQQSY